MRRTRPWTSLPRLALAGACCGFTACTPPTKTADEAGPQVVLSAQAPSADFLVRVCYSGPELSEAGASFSVVAHPTGPADTTAEVVLEASGPGVGTAGEDFDTTQGPVGATLDVHLGFDEDTFVDTRERCVEQRMVHIGMDGPLAAGSEIQVDWEVYAIMRYEEAHRINIGEPTLHIEIEEA